MQRNQGGGKFFDTVTGDRGRIVGIAAATTTDDAQGHDQCAGSSAVALASLFIYVGAHELVSGWGGFLRV